MYNNETLFQEWQLLRFRKNRRSFPFFASSFNWRSDEIRKKMAERYYLCVKFVTSKFKLYHTYTSSYFFLMFSLLLSRIAFDTLHAYYLTAYLHTFSLNTMRNIKPSSADSLQISFIDRELSRLGPFSSGVPTQGRLCSPQIIQSRFFFFGFSTRQWKTPILRKLYCSRWEYHSSWNDNRPRVHLPIILNILDRIDREKSSFINGLSLSLVFGID